MRASSPRLSESDCIKRLPRSAASVLVRRYIPVLMGMARIYWERGNYVQVCDGLCSSAWRHASRVPVNLGSPAFLCLARPLQVERIFRQSAEFASEHETWKLNVAHTFFMQEGKYREAIRYYEPLVKKSWDRLLDVTAMCVSRSAGSVSCAQNQATLLLLLL